MTASAITIPLREAQKVADEIANDLDTIEMEYNTLARTSPDEAYDVVHAWVGSLRAFSIWRGCAAMRRGPEFAGVELILGTHKVRAVLAIDLDDAKWAVLTVRNVVAPIVTPALCPATIAAVNDLVDEF